MQRPASETPRRRAVPRDQDRPGWHLEDRKPQIIVCGKPFHERADVVAVAANRGDQVRAGLERSHPLAEYCFRIDHDR